jgi:single-stranded-DNA-specific exonuclease
MADALDPTERAYLDVERSVTGRRWRARSTDERAGLALTQKAGLPEIVGQVLAARGVDLEGLAAFLDPTLRDHLPDPSSLLGMDVAVARIVRAVTDGEEIAVFADYDVDGATSAALLARFFGALGRAVTVYVPDRVAEGYGPNFPALKGLHEAGAAVVITVDCGTTAHAPLAEAAAIGLDVIVVDHHVAEPALPEAVALINPNRLDETSPHGQLAAVGVTFLLVVALNRALREAGWYGHGHDEPALMSWLDLVALGTVCDVAPLTGVNRALVAQGLKVMARRGNAGIRALADVAGLDERPTAYHAGFVFGPRVNAGGRIGEPGLGARLLAIDDDAEAAALARRLDEYNKERREIEAAVLEDAIAEADAQARAGAPLIFVARAGWHPGVIGIVASRLRERFARPACVVALAEGIGKGSGRADAPVSLGPAVIAARQAGLLIDGGGHARAAGFTVAADAVEALRAFLSDHISRQLDGRPAAPEYDIDGALTPAGATVELVELLDGVGPFGAGNPRPRFAFPAVRVVKADIVGTDHVRCVLAPPSGGERLTAMAFRAADTDLGRALLGTGGVAVHVAGYLQINAWRGSRTARLVIEDAARVR